MPAKNKTTRKRYQKAPSGFSRRKMRTQAGFLFISRSDLHLRPTAGFALILTILLFILKVPLAGMFFFSFYFFIALLPMAVIVFMAFYAYRQSRKQNSNPDRLGQNSKQTLGFENSKLKIKNSNYNLPTTNYQLPTRLNPYLKTTLELLLVTLVFYLLYAPKDFLDFFVAAFSFVAIFISAKGLMFLLGPISIAIFVVAAFFLSVKWKEAKKISKFNPERSGQISNQARTADSQFRPLFRKTIFSLFFFYFFIFAAIATASPGAIKPLTDTLGDVIYTLSGQNIQILKGTDPAQYKKLSSLKDFTSQLSTSIVDTRQNLKQSNDQFKEDLSEARENLSDQVTQTAQNLQTSITEDLTDKLSLSGSSFSDTLKIGKDLKVEGTLEVDGTLSTEDILPQENNRYDLGSESKNWKNFYGLGIVVETADVDEITADVLTAVTANITALDLGQNTISDQNFTGDWDFNGGELSDISSLSADSLSALSIDINDNFSVNSSGIITAGTWNAGPIEDGYIDSVSGDKITGDILGNSASITDDLPLSRITDPTENTAIQMDDNRLTFTFGSDTGANNLFTIEDSDNNIGSGYLMTIRTQDNSLANPLRVIAANVFTAITVNSSGQVGIGTDSQSSQLSVVGGATVGVNFALSTLPDGILAVEDKIGIGTDDPDAPLHILSSENPQVQISYDSSTDATFQLDEDGNLNLNLSGEKLVLNQTMEAEDFQKTCPEGYIWIPGSAKFGTLPGFCVMKWEAKNDGGAATSQPTENPWVSISQESARSECQELGLGYHLISEAEWLTIAENIASVSINDLDDDAGLQLATAHSDNNPANALATTAAADPATTTCDLNETMENAANAWDSGNCEIQGDGSYGGDDNDKGYFGTANQWAANGYSSGASNKSQLRTHVLSNGVVIWDFSGNVWEWTDALSIAQEHPVDASPASEWLEYTAITQYNSFQYVRPPDDGWSATNGIGRLDSDYDDGTATRAFLRGGNWSSTSYSGVFALLLNYTPTGTAPSIGFRCAR